MNQNKNQINFKRERDFGEIFNATFSFIGSESKRLGLAVLYYVVPFLLVASILGVFFSIKQQNDFNAGMTNPFAMISQIGIYGLLNMILVLIATTSLSCTILGYIKLYVSRGRENFGVSDVGKEVLNNFFPVLGASIVAGLLIGIGFMLCLIPGIWIGVSLSLLLPLMVIEGQNFGDAFGRSFRLVKPKFWMALGVLLIAVILVYVLSILFSLPAILLGMKSLFFNFKNPENFTYDFSLTYYILSSLSSLLTYLISAIPTVIVAFMYFSFVEYNERPMLDDKIEQITANE